MARPTAPDSIHWQIEPTDWVVLRALVYLRFGLFYGFTLFVLGSAVAFASEVERGVGSLALLLGVSLLTCLLVLAVVRRASDGTRSAIGRYLSVAGSGSESPFAFWRPTALVALAFLGSVGTALLWTTDAVPTVLLVAVPITVRVVEGAFVALVPFAGSVDRTTRTYVRRVNLSSEATETVEFDLSDRSLSSAWSLGEVTLCWFTGSGPPLLVPLPDEQYRELELAFETGRSASPS